MAPQGGRSEEQTPLLAGQRNGQTDNDEDLYDEPQPCKEVPPQVAVSLCTVFHRERAFVF